MIDLSPAELATLKEMSCYRGSYFFRQATCCKLVAKGLAEPLGTRLKRPAHRITPAGRSALAKESGETRG